jgi:hypothetical protein
VLEFFALLLGHCLFFLHHFRRQLEVIRNQVVLEFFWHEKGISTSFHVVAFGGETLLNAQHFAAPPYLVLHN